ncbi:MAG: hypothetical protein KDJ90_13460 [Nitratireductor sp.]|nr:hypothetical protein [Nitratireductor sp.]
MSLTRLPVAVTLLAVLAFGLAVSGCGRRGGLEPPPSARVLTTDEQGNVVKPQEDAVDRPFVLDPLIQ